MEVSDKLNLMAILQNNWLITFKSVKAMEDKERQNCLKLKTRET
jgi:hypothetical protein